MPIVVDILLNQGVVLNARCQDGQTPLHIAAYTRNGKVVLHLIAAGADVNGARERGFTPRHKGAGQAHSTVAAIYASQGPTCMSSAKLGRTSFTELPGIIGRNRLAL